MGIEPVYFLAFEDDATVVFRDVLVGAHETSVARCGPVLQVGYEVPILLVEKLVSKKLVGTGQAVEEEVAELVVTGVIGGPDFISLISSKMPVHANQHFIVGPEHCRPFSKMAQSRGPSIVAEHGAEGQKQTRPFDVVNVL